MKKYILALGLLIGFSNLYSVRITKEDKARCFQIHAYMKLLTDQVPDDYNELAQFIETHRSEMTLLICQARQLMNKYPDDHVVQSFAVTCNSMQSVLNHFN